MKKFMTLATAFAICASVSAQNGWRIGVTAGSFGNHSHFSGGDNNASALFTNQKYGTGMLGVLFRKQFTNHWSLQTGFNFSSLGFQYTMARDYSLMQPQSHYMSNKMSTGFINIPLTAIYNFNPNCKNVRWFVGGGLSLVGGGGVNNASKTTEATSSEVASMGIATTANMTQSMYAASFLTVNAHWMFGIEKMYKRGTMLSLAAWFNRGFSPLATSNVTYTVNNQTYNHTFTNFNNYAGLTLSYYFKTLSCHKTKASSAAKVIKE